MSKAIKYSKLINKKKNDVDTVILDRTTYWSSLVEKENKNIKNIDIQYGIKRSDRKKYMLIYSTNAKNIYFKDEENLGGITFPVSKKDYHLHLDWAGERYCNIKTVNIIYDDKVEKIELDENVKDIEMGVFVNAYNIKEELGISVRVKSTKYEIDYYFNFDGTKNIKYDLYNVYKSNIIDGDLDLRKISNFKTVTCEGTMSCDTLIINKKQIESLNDCFDEKIFVKTLRIVEDSDMKLMPYKEIEFNDVLVLGNNYFTNKNKDKIIFLDDNEFVKIYDLEGIKQDDGVEEFKFIINFSCDLIVIKYTSGNYKIIDLNKEYDIDYMFGKFLELNIDKYLFYQEDKKTILDCINNFDYFTIFEEEIISNELLNGIYNDYLKFMERIKELNKRGLSYTAIKYLIDKKYVNIINYSFNDKLNIDDISKEEIDSFNELGKSYVLKKIKKK